MSQITIDLGDNLTIKRTVKKVSVIYTDEIYLTKEITDEEGNVTPEELLKDTSTRSATYDSSYLGKLPDELFTQAYALLTAEASND